MTMNNYTEYWLRQYSCTSGLSKQQVKWLCLFAVDEFNALLLEVIPHDVIINSPKLTIPDCLELLMEIQGYRIG
jgi:hypothetical protein